MKNKHIICRIDKHQIVLIFTCDTAMRFNHRGKYWPLVTRCEVFVNNKLLKVGEVIKHHDDDHNLNLACRLAAKKAMNYFRYYGKQFRRLIWEEILKSLPDDRLRKETRS